VVALGATVTAGVMAIGEWIDSSSQTVERSVPSTATATQTRQRTVDIHHIATNKNSVSDRSGGPWTPIFEAIFASGGLTLNIPENKVPVLDHAGPHPPQYHLAVFSALTTSVTLATQDFQPGTPEYQHAAGAAIKETLNVLGVQCMTPGTPLNLLITKGVPNTDGP